MVWSPLSWERESGAPMMSRAIAYLASQSLGSPSREDRLRTNERDRPGVVVWTLRTIAMATVRRSVGPARQVVGGSGRGVEQRRAWVASSRSGWMVSWCPLVSCLLGPRGVAVV